MAKTSNYFWWAPEKWREKLSSAGFVDHQVQGTYEIMKNMTYHQRRLYIRNMMKEPRVSQVVRRACTT